MPAFYTLCAFASARINPAIFSASSPFMGDLTHLAQYQ